MDYFRHEGNQQHNQYDPRHDISLICALCHHWSSS